MSASLYMYQFFVCHWATYYSYDCSFKTAQFSLVLRRDCPAFTFGHQYRYQNGCIDFKVCFSGYHFGFKDSRKSKIISICAVNWLYSSSEALLTTARLTTNISNCTTTHCNILSAQPAEGQNQHDRSQQLLYID